MTTLIREEFPKLIQLSKKLDRKLSALKMFRFRNNVNSRELDQVIEELEAKTDNVYIRIGMMTE